MDRCRSPRCASRGCRLRPGQRANRPSGRSGGRRCGRRRERQHRCCQSADWCVFTSLVCVLHIDLSYIMTFLEYKCQYPQVLILIKRHITARFPGCVCVGTPFLVSSSVVCGTFLIGVLYAVCCGSNVTSLSLQAAALIHVLCQVQELHSSTASVCLAVCLQRHT